MTLWCSRVEIYRRYEVSAEGYVCMFQGTLNVEEPCFSETSVKLYQTACLGGSWISVVGIAARLWAGRSGVRIPLGARVFFLFSETPRTTYSVGTWVKRPGRQANRLMPRLIMYGAVPLLSLCGVDREKHTFTFPAECLTYHKYVLRMRYLEIFVAALICRHISM